MSCLAVAIITNNMAYEKFITTEKKAKYAFFEAAVYKQLIAKA